MLRVQECVSRVLLLGICIGYAIGCNSNDNEIYKVTGISSITVQRGHSITITSNTYTVRYNKTKYDDCLVYVTSTPTFSCGELSPDVFNYSSKPDLSFTHYGCDRGTENIDVALSLISSDLNVITTEHFTIEVIVMNISDPILQPSDKVIVATDSWKALTSLKLSDNLTCEYAIVTPIDLPYYGIVSGPIRQWLPCNSSQLIEYSLIHHEWDQPEDRIIVAIRNNGSVSYEQIPVIINSSNDMITLCTLEKGVALLTTFNCYTPVDEEDLISQNCSCASNWKFHITKGVVNAISLLTSHSPYLATSTFTFGQLQNGMVAYSRKSDEDNQNHNTYHYQYSVYDVYGRVIFNNSITTRNTGLAGRHVGIVINAGIDVVEGHNATMTTDVLEFVIKNCTNITLVLVGHPKHGYFKSTQTNATQNKFTLRDLHRANIVFQHSGADNFGDRAIWQVQCSGVSIGKFLQPIRVLMRDDSPPHVNITSMLSVYSDSVLQLSRFHLQATDVDSCDTTLKYTILHAYGQFYMSKEDALNNNGTRKVTQFQQRDIDHGNIWYRPPEYITATRSDIVLFNVSDESSPPNVLPNQRITINISYKCTFCEATLDPQRISEIPVVEFAGETVLSTTHFSFFTNQVASNDWLEIHIVEPPHFGSVFPNNFTLDSLRNNNVAYRHNGISHDCNDSFVFQMRNITGTKVYGKMVVSVVKLNTTHNVALEVNPLEFSIIRPTLAANSIVTTNAPVCPEHILFIIQSVPAFGTINRDGELKIGSWFSLKHLRNGLLSYRTDLSSNQSKHIYNDSFSFSLLSPIGDLMANGKNLSYYPIRYDLLDPVVTLNPPTTLYRCGGNEFLYCYNLSTSNINVISNIANDSELRIIVQNGPSCGRLILNNRRVSEFTMSQLKNKKIAYEFNATLCNNTNFTDKFEFIVTINGQTAMNENNYLLHLYWSYVMVEQPKIEIKETEETVNITIRRYGYLNQTTRVFCTKGSLSASICNTCHQLKRAIFSPGKTEAYCNFEIENNNIAEGISIKKYYVALKNPEGAIITDGNVTDVYISDREDFPVIQFTGVSQSVSSSSCTHEITVTEGEDEMVSVMVERIGDSSKEVSVMCTAHEVSASSSQDYQERVKKRVTFAPGQTKAYCNVTILDDDEFEPRESFRLKLDRPRILAVTNSSADTLCVYIEEDERDRPLVFFGHAFMSAREKKTNYSIQIPIHRTGKSDIARTEVFYRTRLFKNDTANDADFEGYTAKSVVFKSVQTVAHGELLILADDDDREDDETLHVELIAHTNYKLGKPSVIKITILESYEVLSFSSASIAINESDITFTLHLNRTGSLEFSFNISSGFTLELPSLLYLPDHIPFPANVTNVDVTGIVADNIIYNGRQTARYCLISSANKEETRFVQQCIDIAVYDEEDYPTVKFETANYKVPTPDYHEECSVLAVAIVRNNDITYDSSSVQYSTIDDSALAGKHYYESSGVLHFAPYEERKFIYVQICTHHLPTNQTTRFNIGIKNDNDYTRVTTPSVTEVLILGKEPIAPYFHKEPLIMFSDTFPSYLHHSTGEQKSLVCVTPCDPLLVNYFDASFCSKHGINNNLTIYEWEISYDNTPFIPVSYSTFFTSPHTRILDKFYMLPGSRVRCKATAVDVTGIAGYKMPSQALEIPEPNCSNRTARVAAEFQPFSLFTGQSRDSIKLTGSLSTAGNAVPLLYSQHSPSALPILTDYPKRNGSCILLAGQAHHLTHAEVSRVVITDCGWEFEVSMSLQELEEQCQARVNHTAEETTIYLELELAYFYGNVTSGIELEQYRNHLNISGSFRHERLPDHKNVNYSKDDAGFIKLLDVSFNDILMVKFQSFAKFTGQFVAEGTGNVSSSVSSGSSNQHNSLLLQETEQDVHNCTQIWTFHMTDVLISGPYNVTLIPCVLPDHLTWSPSVMFYCVQMAPITFQLYVPMAGHVLPHFEASETEMVLLKRARNGSYCGEWRFGSDDLVYGGIKIDVRYQQHVTVAVQKIVACSTACGYVPQYDYKASLTGCLTDTHFITELYTIMDMDNVHNVDNDFDAKFTDDIKDVHTGWSFRTAPLFDGESKQWFIHIIYNKTYSSNDVIFKHDIRLIHLDTPSSSTDSETTSVAWCEAIITVTIVLSVVVIVLIVLSLICWKWNKMKDGCVAIFGDWSRTKAETSPLSKISRRSHRYRPEIQELPHAFISPNAIHADTEQCTKTCTATTAQTPAGGSTNKRLAGSKKYIVETTM